MFSRPTVNDRYELINKLGSGTTSDVYLAQDHMTGGQVALKVLKDAWIKRNGLSETQAEVDILQNLDHPNINSVTDFQTDGVWKSPNFIPEYNKTFMALEYVHESRDFFDLVQKVGPMGEDGARLFIDQMLSAIKYCHDNNVVHRDLKLENTRVDKDLKIQILDFGFATNENIENLHAYKGTQSYMAPEIREGKEYDGRKVDIFSIGVILNILITGNFAFNKADKKDFFYKKLMDGRYIEYWIATKADHFTSPEARDLIQKMLHYDPSQRITMEGIMEHPFMTKVHDKEAAKRRIQREFFGIAIPKETQNEIIEEVRSPLITMTRARSL